MLNLRPILDVNQYEILSNWQHHWYVDTGPLQMSQEQHQRNFYWAQIVRPLFQHVEKISLFFEVDVYVNNIIKKVA